MAYQYYYPKTLRNISYAVLNMFKDIGIKKYDASGTAIQDLAVPLSFNQPEKSAMWIAQNHYFDKVGTEVGQRSYVQLPRMALMWDGLSYNADRVYGSNEYREWLASSLEISGPDAQTIVVDAQPTPYDIGYTLAIRTDSMDYMSQILENILPYFNPNRTIRVKEFSFFNIERELNVKLTGVTPVVTADLSESDRRQVSCDIGLNVEAFMYRPFSHESIIKVIHSKYYTIEDGTTL